MKNKPSTSNNNDTRIDQLQEQISELRVRTARIESRLSSEASLPTQPGQRRTQRTPRIGDSHRNLSPNEDHRRRHRTHHANCAKLCHHRASQRRDSTTGTKERHHHDSSFPATMDNETASDTGRTTQTNTQTGPDQATDTPATTTTTTGGERLETALATSGVKPKRCEVSFLSCPPKTVS